MLRVRLLGALVIERDGAVIDSPVTQRPWALFAYVALAARAVPRPELASCFWPEVLDQSARASLRSALWVLRRSLGDALDIDAERVALGGGEAVWLDTREFARLAAAAPESALELCRGELLEGLEEDWAVLARQQHRERVIELLEGLAAAAEQIGDGRAAVRFTRRQVECDPLDEEATRRLMARLSAVGDRAAAIRAYQELDRRLRRSLGVLPSATTRAVAAGLREDAALEPDGRSAESGEAGDSGRSESGGPGSDRADTGRPSSGKPGSGRSAAGSLARSPRASGRPALRGRETELDALTAAWEATAAQGHAAVAVLRGEGGIGKTRLAAELQDLAAGDGTVAVCAALELGGSAPLSLWAELVGTLLPGLPAPPPEATWPVDLAVLGVALPDHFDAGALPPALVPDLQRTRLFEAVVALVGLAARRAPLLLVFEDVHNADWPSLELAGYVSRRLASAPVMLLMTRRERPRSPGADRLELALRSRGVLRCELDLAPLDEGGVAALARDVGRRLSAAEIDRVVREAEGNPLLAVETARALAAGRQDVASSLRGLTRGALAGVDDGTRELIETLAVAGRPVSSAELEAALPSREDGSAARALDSGLIDSEGDRLAFRHALLRDAAYEEMPEPTRAARHRRWARSLMTGGGAGAAEVARQLRLGHADLEAVPLLAQASQESRAVGALDQAIEYLEEALGISPAQSALWLELGELEAWRGRRSAAEEAFDRARELLGTAPGAEQARGWLRRARAYHGVICVPRAVRESAAEAATLLAGCGPELLPELREALAAQAWADAVAGSVESAEALLDQLSSAGDAGDDLGTYDIEHARALALMRRGRFAEAYAPSIAAGEAVQRADRPDLAYGCWANAASAANAAGDPQRALAFLERGMSAVRGRGLHSLELHMLAARCFVLRGLDRLEEAQETARAEMVLAEQLGDPGLLAIASLDCGLVALGRAEYETAATQLAAALATPAPISAPQTRLARAEALARSGDGDGAESELRQMVLEPVRPSDFPAALVPRLARAQALVALARGDRELAARRLSEAIAGWEALVAPSLRADSIATVLADLGRPVVGLIEPERELARTQTELASLESPTEPEANHARVP